MSAQNRLRMSAYTLYFHDLNAIISYLATLELLQRLQWPVILRNMHKIEEKKIHPTKHNVQ